MPPRQRSPEHELVPEATPRHAVACVQPTGAGDAFAGTLATAIIARCPLVEAVRLAVAAAACAVTGFGAQESYPDRRALEAMARGVRLRRKRRKVCNAFRV